MIAKSHYSYALALWSVLLVPGGGANSKELRLEQNGQDALDFSR